MFNEICDRIAVLDQHQLAFIGTPKEFKEKHKSELKTYKDSLDMQFKSFKIKLLQIETNHVTCSSQAYSL